MPILVCTSRLEGIGPLQPTTCSGSTVAELLAAAEAQFPRLKSYVLDDQQRVRKHVAIFIDGALPAREKVLAAPLSPNSEVYIMQALSGG